MKRIAIEIIKNINNYLVNKYYNDVCTDVYGEENRNRQFFIELQNIMKSDQDIDEYVDVSINTLKWVCEFVENKQDYDKLGCYGDFCYTIKNILRENENFW